MTNIDICSAEWNKEATEREAELGGIRIGPLKPLGTLPIEDESDDEETLQQEEKMLRQKLTNQLKQMKEREAEGREYLRQHGIIAPIEVPGGIGMDYAHR